MTAEPELLPLPPLAECSEDSVQEWGRANVEAHTEALRAEVERYKVAWEEFSARTEWVQQTAKPRELGMHRADVLRLHIEQAEARAERLAEAGRRVTAAFRAHGSNITPDGGRTRAECEAAMLALDAALEQEAGHE